MNDGRLVGIFWALAGVISAVLLGLGWIVSRLRVQLTRLVAEATARTTPENGDE